MFSSSNNSPEMGAANVVQGRNQLFSSSNSSQEMGAANYFVSVNTLMTQLSFKGHTHMWCRETNFRGLSTEALHNLLGVRVWYAY